MPAYYVEDQEKIKGEKLYLGPFVNSKAAFKKKHPASMKNKVEVNNLLRNIKSISSWNVNVAFGTSLDL